MEGGLTLRAGLIEQHQQMYLWVMRIIVVMIATTVTTVGILGLLLLLAIELLRALPF